MDDLEGENARLRGIIAANKAKFLALQKRARELRAENRRLWKALESKPKSTEERIMDAVREIRGR